MNKYFNFNKSKQIERRTYKLNSFGKFFFKKKFEVMLCLFIAKKAENAAYLQEVP